MILGCQTRPALQIVMGWKKIILKPSKTINQKVFSTQGVVLLRLEVETATIADKWGVGPGSIAKKLMVQIGIVKPKRL